MNDKDRMNCHQILLKSSVYYRNLSDFNKSIFCMRVLVFYRTTKFTHEKGFHVSLEMKLLVSSAFAQITFGLKRDRLYILNKIFIAPRNYSYKHIDQLFKGDVNLNTKTVSLAWPAVEQGFNTPDDGVNLCLHEFAHCLIIENSKTNFLSAVFNKTSLDNWRRLARMKIQKINNNDHTFLRSYAGTNLMELFAVSLEAFFERPHHFYHNDPKFYKALSALLNQDPRLAESPVLKVRSRRY